MTAAAIAPPPADLPTDALRRRLDDPATQLAVIERAPDGRRDEHIAAMVANTPFRRLVGPSDAIERGLRRHGADTEALTEIAGLLQLFSTLAACREMDVLIEWQTRRQCPLFHVDAHPLRLLCAYLGPGLEYLDEADADRDALGRGGRAPGRDPVCRGGPQTVRRVAHQAVALFKGTGWPGNAGRGLVHRSPPTSPRCPRLVLRIDVRQ
ncbi:hypothetical protein PC39_13862 [Salinisphaera sp. PC39]|uniref:DUF1826 domain-containing protein n=1 Tax=Salinisphaera sp. PC39 TaxID=1304156 RepID=UPI00334134FD